MVTKTSRDQLRKYGAVSLASLLVAASIVAYRWWSAAPSLEVDKKLRRSVSRCVVVTQGIQNDDLIRDLLFEDSVMLLAPGCTAEGRLKAASRDNAYKVIACTTWQSVWACVRHFRKHTLLVRTSEVPNGVPADIGGYVNDISDI
ncbi:AaceriADR410Cp [[Ashbya] aceris (nom. inval.)]|nr:AaceriADR410Cp [[Ashbya] aceris (nom. inval.)]